MASCSGMLDVAFDDLCMYHRFSYGISHSYKSFKPRIHQKKIRNRLLVQPMPKKGLGFIKQFNGYRYPIENKNL